MTGLEAWTVIAPILAAHSVYEPQSKEVGFNVIDQAYVVVYAALNEYDKKRKEKR